MSPLQRVEANAAARPQWSARWKTLSAASLAIAPAVIFYSLLLRLLNDLPFRDDYHALLDFLNNILPLGGRRAKLAYFFAAQHNEYKLYFEHTLAWLEIGLTGHISFGLLSAIGDSFVLLLGILLWKMFLPEHQKLSERIILFIPVSCLLFQLQYAETLNWAMASLQNLPVLVFSLESIYLLVLETRTAYCGAAVCLALAVASSGNGLLLMPLGILILILRRHYARIPVWLVVSAVCIAAYAFRYAVIEGGGPLRPADLGTRLLYLIFFLGSAGARPNSRYTWSMVIVCLFWGSLLCILLMAIARTGYFRKRPPVGYCVLFLLTTAVGVSGLRAKLGVFESLSSRYGIYSALLSIFVWFAIAERFLMTGKEIQRKNLLTGVIAATVLFAGIMDASGFRFLTRRNDRIQAGIAAYEKSISSVAAAGPILPAPGQSKEDDEMERRGRQQLEDSTRLGIYRPPQL